MNNDKLKFVLTDKHIALAHNFYVGWQYCEFGAPEINPKRPYGDSDVTANIHEILTGEQDAELTENQEEAYEALHKEMMVALQIILCTKSFVPGTYVRDCSYMARSWKLADG